MIGDLFHRFFRIPGWIFSSFSASSDHTFPWTSLSFARSDVLDEGKKELHISFRLLSNEKASMAPHKKKEGWRREAYSPI